MDPQTRPAVIRRKPVPSPQPSYKSSPSTPGPLSPPLPTPALSTASTTTPKPSFNSGPSTPALSTATTVDDFNFNLAEQTSKLRLDTSSQDDVPVQILGEHGLGLYQSPTNLSPEATHPKERSLWRAAFEETRHFAGGLISHPYVASKHYSILRHSHGLVYYKGPNTNVAITIFSDKPLPPDRKIWMQQKGFSGNTGMNVKAFFRANSNWIDVTPDEQVDPSQLPQGDERAWQRDIKKFLKKAPKEIRNHVPRETQILRIPAMASDGYFRIVLCDGEGSKKVLCPSPVFRVASTSVDSSSLRGASLATLPFELGIKVASTIGSTYATNLVTPVTDAIQTKISSYQPGVLVQQVGTSAYDASGIQDRIDGANERFDLVRDASYDAFQDESMIEAGPEVVGKESGPEPPFPIRFKGKVVPSTGRSTAEYGTPTANLSGVPDDALLRLNGIYIGWACINSKTLTDISGDWYEAVISVGPSPYAPPSIAQKKVAWVQILRNFGPNTTFFDTKLEVMVMCFLRPFLLADPSHQQSQIFAEKQRDISIARASLSRAHWGPEMTLQRIKTERSERSLEDKYVDAREKMQKRVDSIPAHWAGVRTTGAELRDRSLGRGGLWVAR